MAQREGFLGLKVFVGHDSHQGRHEYRNNALHGKEPFDLRTKAHIAEVAAEGSQVGAPCGVLQEVHQDQPET